MPHALWLICLGAAMLLAAGTGRAGDDAATAIDDYLNSDFAGKVSAVKVSDKHVQVSGTAPHDAPIPMLAELRPQDGFGDEPQRLTPLDGEAFRHDFPRFDDGYDRALSRWAIVTDGGEFLSHARYPVLPEAAPVQTVRSPIDKKGLGGIHPDPKLFPDLVDLGVRQITVNINLGSLIRFSDADALSHEVAGREYHFSASTVATFDRLLRFAKDHRIVVSAIILVPRVEDAASPFYVLTHPQAVDGHYSMANVATPEGTRHYAAAIDFLAARYRPSGPHGHIANWIVHNEVDSGWIWTNMGEVSAADYMDTYVKVLRVTHAAARQHDPSARVFISLTHCWNAPHAENPLRFYRGRELLGRLARYTKCEGDFAWGVAFHPYPENLFQPATWNDASATDDFDTPRITFRNIELLDRWMRQERFRTAGGRTRGVLLSEQGFHTPDASTASQQLQAAALAYAWKKIEHLDTIEAMHYHRWIDHEHEGGLNLGLWTVQPGSVTWPAERKLSWHVFQALGTERETETIDFARPIIGIEAWSEIRPSHRPGRG